MSIELIQWDARFETGIASIDFEHRELIALINSALEGFGLPGTRGEETSETEQLGEIYARISAHFALEETKMSGWGYVHYEEHKAAHEQLLDEIRDIMDEFESDDTAAIQNLPKRLGDWFTIHFRTHDARLHHMSQSNHQS